MIADAVGFTFVTTSATYDFHRQVFLTMTLMV